MQTAHEGTSEVAILGRVLEPERANLSVAAARSILGLELAPADVERMRLLLAGAKKGELTPPEQVEIDNYERVGHLISLMKSKARRSLKIRHFSLIPTGSERSRNSIRRRGLRR